MKEKVSVLVAIYNIEKYVEKCIQSILDQEYSNLEIILIDDNSSDLSGQICDEYAKRDKRVVVIHHEKNTRQSGVRNDGLDAATGDYIVFVDGDDWLAPDFITYMLGIIKETGTDMAINLVNYTTRDNKQVDYFQTQIWSAEKTTAELLYPHLEIGVWNKIYKRDFIEKHKLRFLEELFTAEGYRFIVDAAQRANNVAVGCRKVYYYRLNNPTSATTKYDIRQSMGALFACEGIKKDLIIKTPLVMNALYQHIWLNYFWNIRQIIALKLIDEKRDIFQESVRYVKEHAFSVAQKEKNIMKKIKYYLTGIFPVLSAKFKNYIFDTKLKIDIKKIH